MSSFPDLPELSVQTGRTGSSVWDYRVFLCRGMSSLRKQTSDKMLANPKEVCGFRAKRLPLVLALRDLAASQYSESPSHRTLISNYQILRTFYVYCDEHLLDPTNENAVALFISWADARRQTKNPLHHYSSAIRLARMLSECTEISVDRYTIPVRLTKPRRQGNSSRDTQDLEKTFRFGQLLAATSNRLSTEAIIGPLPLEFVFEQKSLTLWAGVASDDALRALHIAKGRPAHDWRPDQSRVHKLAGGSLSERRTLVNLRIEAELAIFLAQTGMNLAQAFTLSIGRFRYQTREGGYLVKGIYKDRRHGEVAFEIFTAYRAHFEGYLKWRASIAEEGDTRLFPFSARPGDPPRQEHHCNGLRRLCKQAGIEYVGARDLRCTRVNYFLRRSDDLKLTADVAQHSADVLMNYQRPHHQRAATELTSFWNDLGSTMLSAGAGTCSGSPQPMAPRPGQPIPDCRSAAGCLFCLDHRDEMSLDYAWSLVSYRHLKSIELATYPPAIRKLQAPTPPEIVIASLSEKLRMMSQHHHNGPKFVREAEERAMEGEFHPRWSQVINAAESYHDTIDL